MVWQIAKKQVGNELQRCFSTGGGFFPQHTAVTVPGFRFAIIHFTVAYAERMQAVCFSASGRSNAQHVTYKGLNRAGRLSAKPRKP